MNKMINSDNNLIKLLTQVFMSTLKNIINDDIIH